MPQAFSMPYRVEKVRHQSRSLRHLHLPKQMMGPYGALFFFWFQRGLAVATALRRLAKYPKSVSEPALSLTDRPWPSEGRIQKV